MAEIGGVANYLESTGTAGINQFIKQRHAGELISL